MKGKTCDGPPTEYTACSVQLCDDERSLVAGVVVPKRVGFTVKDPSPSLEDGALQFKTVLTNYGEDFNKDTGRFVCDVPGLYLFTATILGHSRTAHYCSCRIHVGSAAKVLVWAHTKHTGNYPSGTGSLVYELTTGDEVYLGSCTNYNNFDTTTHFSGVLIQ